VRPRSLTLRAVLLFAVMAALVVSVAGIYLYASMRATMIERGDAGLVGRVERFRALMQDTLTLDDLRARPALFENMLGNEQDVLVFIQPGQQPVVTVNPLGEALPGLTPVPIDRPLALADVRDAPTREGGRMRVVAAQARAADGAPLQIQAAHLLVSETRMLARYRNQIAAAVLLAFLSIALLGWVTLRRALRPLHAMAAQAARITPASLDTRLSLDDTPHELRELTASFNAMLDRLADGYQRLAQFSADLAHEIRTPVGALMGNCQVALYQRRAPEEYENLLACTLEELERISRLIENILFLARADDARAALNYADLDLSDELGKVADYFEGLAEERGIRIECESRGALRADLMLFRRALGNLVANAVRYADPDSVVRLSAHAEAQAVRICVDNQGPPIPAERLGKLFDRFYQGDAARSTATDSSGLGLAIVRAIMALHGGSAAAENADGGRIRFTLRYPAAGEPRRGRNAADTAAG
jgi:two-component system heavy metal sensor histidine kinase CusS